MERYNSEHCVMERYNSERYAEERCNWAHCSIAERTPADCSASRIAASYCCFPVTATDVHSASTDSGCRGASSLPPLWEPDRQNASIRPKRRSAPGAPPVAQPTPRNSDPAYADPPPPAPDSLLPVTQPGSPVPRLPWHVAVGQMTFAAPHSAADARRNAVSHLFVA